MGNSSKKSGFTRKVAGVFLAAWMAMIFMSVAMPVAFAATEGILPKIDSENAKKDCFENVLNKTSDELKTILKTPTVEGPSQSDITANDILGCALKTGRVSLWMVPYFIRYVIEFILNVGGLVAVGGILYGGATYTFSGLSNDKESGKKAIIYSIAGMILMYSAWAIVNIVIGLLTL